MEIVVIYVYSGLWELNAHVQMGWSCLLTKGIAYVSAFKFICSRAIMICLVTWYLDHHTRKKFVTFCVNCINNRQVHDCVTSTAYQAYSCFPAQCNNKVNLGCLPITYAE